MKKIIVSALLLLSSFVAAYDIQNDNDSADEANIYDTECAYIAQSCVDDAKGLVEGACCFVADALDLATKNPAAFAFLVCSSIVNVAAAQMNNCSACMICNCKCIGTNGYGPFTLGPTAGALECTKACQLARHNSTTAGCAKY